MKNQPANIRWKNAVLLLLVSGAMLSACKKDAGTSVQIPAAGLMVYNLVSDQPAISVALSGNVLPGSPLGYTNFNGYYQPIYTGSRQVAVYTNPWDSAVSQSSFTFRDSTDYSLFVIGAKGVYGSVVTADTADTAAGADHAFIRYINAIADSSAPSVTLTQGGSVIDQQPAAFAHVSAFQPVNPGTLTIGVSNGGSIASSRTIDLEKGKAYTALLIGQPAATDSLHKVQVRYVSNGSVSPQVE